MQCIFFGSGVLYLRGTSLIMVGMWIKGSGNVGENIFRGDGGTLGQKSVIGPWAKKYEHHN